ncbi:MAG: PAS domain S-box protein [Coriobacteriia bacterium]
MVLDFVQSVALMIAGSVAVRALIRRLRLSPRQTQVIFGVLFGLLAVVSMLSPAIAVAGILVDSRSVAVMIAGLFGGPLAVCVTAAIAGIARVVLGGSGMLSGIAGFIVVALMASIYRRLRPRHPYLFSLPAIALFSVAVHAMVLAIIVFASGRPDLSLATDIALPMLLLIPAGVVLVAWFMLDYEQQDEAERLLSGRESRFRMLFEGVRAPMLLIEPDSGRIVDANPAAVDFYGWTADELRSMTVDQINTLTPEHIRAEMRKAIEARKNHFEFQHRRADGSLRYVDVYSGTVMVDSAQLLYSFIVDSTLRREAELELLEREWLLRTVFETTRDGFCLLNTDGTIRMVNRAYAEMSGFSEEKLLSIRYTSLCAPSDRGAADEALSSIAGSHAVLFESVQQRQDGSVFDVEVSAAALPDDDGIVCFIRDISTRKQRTAELEKYRGHLEELVELRTARLGETIIDLTAANQTISRFLMNVSHELRTPLNSIIGFSGVLLAEISGPINPEQQRQLSTVRSAGEHLLSLINDILDVQRIASGDTKVTIESVDAVALVQQLLEDFSSETESKHITAEALVPAESLIVDSDPLRLKQILTNLVGNAVKFTDQGGFTISLSVDAADRVAIAVADTGPGIPEEDLDRVFEPFVQVHSFDGSKPQGTGLGLTISQDLAKLLGGDISVTSRVGVGSTFTVLLPRRNPCCDTSPSRS